MTRWTTIGVSARSGEALSALCVDDQARRRHYAAEGWLCQRDDATGATRTVLGFRDGLELVPADALDGYLRVELDEILRISARADEYRREREREA